MTITYVDAPFVSDVVATRTLESPDGLVRIEIGRPRLFDEVHPEQGYVCPISIEGLEKTPVRLSVGGVDSVQALILALGMIGDRLKADSKDLLFLETSNLGFPVTQHLDEDSMMWTVRVNIQ